MRQGTERLSLAEIEALAQDSLQRCGLSREAAFATALAISIAEKQGDRAAGMGRLLELIEGLRTGAINSQPSFRTDVKGKAHFDLDADGGISDAAIFAGLSRCETVLPDLQTATLRVFGTGDEPSANPWITHLAAREIAGFAINPAYEAQAEMANTSASQAVENAMLARRKNIQYEDRIRGLDRADGSVTFVVMTKVAAGSVPVCMEGEPSMPKEKASKRKQLYAEQKGIGVPTELLVRILAS